MKKLPQFFLSGSSARIIGILTTGPAVENHISPKMARALIAMYQTTYHSWFLVYRRVPLRRPHLHLHHLHRRTLYLTSADTRTIPQPEEVEVRVRSYGETRCINQPTENRNKNERREEVQSDLLHELPDWQQELRENLVDECSPQSHGETLSLDIKTLPVLLMNYQWSREQKWNRVRASMLSTRTFRRTQIAISA